MIQDDASVIAPTVKELKENFLTHQTKDLAFRKQQLKNFLRGLNALKNELYDALQKDLGYKDQFFANMIQLSTTFNEVEHDVKNLEKWAKKRDADTTLMCLPGKSYLKPEPFGLVLVLGAWNYPYQTSLTPVSSAIAAGNSVILKPSELAPHSSNVIAKLFDLYLDKRFYRVIEGAIEVAKNITTQPFDLIIFTGGPEKGKLVAQAAAKNLVPCILELGGKSPCIVDGTTELHIAARRIIHTKFFNSGQTCISPDYILVQENLKDELLNILKQTVISFYGENPKDSGALCKIINEFHTERILSYLKDCGGDIIIGGNGNVKDKFIEPTIVSQPNIESNLMKEEIFGPILPVITYKNRDDAIQFINQRHKPLALYYYGTNNEFKEQIIQQTSSGGVCTNDCVFHAINPNLPFGGVGNSGYGALFGKTGFDQCSHMKPVLEKSKFDALLARYPPYNDNKKKVMEFLTKVGGITTGDIINWIKLIMCLLVLIILIKSDYIQGKSNRKNDL